MPKLSVNVDHVATVREARKIDIPDPVLAAGLAELAGAQGITVHLREDRRHIQDRDVVLLRKTVKTRLNLEMAATPEMIDRAREIRPDLVTLVPERREEVTTEGGLDVILQRDTIQSTVERLHEREIPVSLFIDPNLDQIKAAHQIHADAVEIHTGSYCNATTERLREEEFKKIANAVKFARKIGLRVAAGHGLDYRNVTPIAQLEGIEELNIGHSIIARAVLVGIERAVREMLAALREA